MERLGVRSRRRLGRFGPIEGDTAAIVRAWPAAVGETVAGMRGPRGSTATASCINTSSSTWAFELGRLAETILAQLRAELGEAHRRALVRARSAARARAGQVRRRESGREPAAAERAVAAEIAAAIEDEELRRLVARAAAASLSRGSRHPLTTGVSDTLLPARK